MAAVIETGAQDQHIHTHTPHRGLHPRPSIPTTHWPEAFLQQVASGHESQALFSSHIGPDLDLIRLIDRPSRNLAICN